MVKQARAEGVDLIGPDGLLSGVSGFSARAVPVTGIPHAELLQ
ncbi:hypothetical protein [Micromonospora sp. NPDC000729]